MDPLQIELTQCLCPAFPSVLKFTNGETLFLQFPRAANLVPNGHFKLVPTYYQSLTKIHGVAPPTDGSVTLPETIDFHRKNNPTTPIYVFIEDEASNITKITHLEFGRACDRVAHYLRSGRRGPEKEVVAVLALTDSLLYQAIVIGIMRAGLIPYPMSPRNTAEATINLLKETSCHRLLMTRTTLKPLFDKIQAELASTDPNFALFIEEVPPLLEIYPKLGHENDQDPFEPYPAGSRPSLDDICAYVHSSGSTGLPKSIPQTYRVLIHWASFPVITDHREQPYRQILATQPIPCFHMFGFSTQILMTLYGLATVALYPPTATTTESQPMQPNPQNVIEHTKRTNCTGMYAIPAWLQIWAQDPQIVDFMTKLDFVGYGGGPLPSKVGAGLVAAGVHVIPLYGGTEFGVSVNFRNRSKDKKDWEYTPFSRLAKTRWDDQGDGTYELQFLTCETHQLAVENLLDVKGYTTSDLFVPHPTKPDLWKIIGRKDDVITHTSGEKTSPAPIENVLMSSPYITGSVMFGRERDHPGVLIELKPQYAIDVNNEQEVIKARNLVWPIVEEANKVAPSFSRLYKEFILFVSQSKPLPRAGKGTVMRKATLNVYSKEIDDIYTAVGAIANVDNVDPPASWSIHDVEAWIIFQFADIQSNEKTFPTTADLFENGLDSLGAAILRHRVVGALQASKSPSAARLVTQSTIYENSTISKLAYFIVGAVTSPDQLTSITTSREDEIERMIKKFSFAESTSTSAKWDAVVDQNYVTVLITGTTGNLGAQLVDVFLRDGRVKKVYALNRPSSVGKGIKARHEERFIDKGLDVAHLVDDRLVLLEGDASSADLGLVKEVYEEMRDHVNVIIHNAWRLDFNLTLSSFESNIRGTHHLAEFARSSRHASSLKFLFTSSISSASSWDESNGSYPEDVILDSKYAVGSGYGESKYIAERILAQSGLHFTSLRIGQVAGGLPNGAWATTDWVPIFIKSSLELGVLPSAAGVVSWLPMHAVAQTVLDVTFSAIGTRPALNIVHPRPVAWDSIIAAVNDAMVKEDVVKERLLVVEFSKWFELLEAKAHEDTKHISNIPAIKLIEFFRRIAEVDRVARQQGKEDGEVGGQPKFATEKIQMISETMKGVPVVGREDAALWVKYWKCVGLFGR